MGILMDSKPSPTPAPALGIIGQTILLTSGHLHSKLQRRNRHHRPFHLPGLLSRRFIVASNFYIRQYSPTLMAPRRQQCRPNAFPAWCVFVVLLRMRAAPESGNSICAFHRRNETQRHEEILPLWTRDRNLPAQAEVFSPAVPVQISPSAAVKIIGLPSKSRA
jgi:hypothetical protein